MLRRTLYSLGAVALIILALAAPASAYNGSTPYPTQAQWLDLVENPPPAIWDDFKKGLNGATTSTKTAESGIVLKGPFTAAGGDGHSIADEYYRIRRTAPFKNLPSAVSKTTLLGRLSNIGLGVAAFGLGWKIGRAIDTKWLHFGGDYGLDTYTDISTLEWHWDTGTFGGKLPAGGNWVLRFDGYEVFSNCTTMSCAGFDAGQLNAYVVGQAHFGAASGWQYGTLRSDITTCGAASSGKTCELRYMTMAEAVAALHADSELQDYVAQPFQLSDTCATCTDTTIAPGDPDYADAVDVLKNADPTTTATIIHEGHCFAPAVVPAECTPGGLIVPPSPTYPGGVEDPWNPTPQPSPAPAGEPEFEPQPTTFTMPQLQPLETYPHYLARLRVLGWVGTATIYGIPDYATDPTLNPQTVMAQPVPAPGTTAVPTTVTPTIWINEPQPEPSPGDCPDCTGDPTAEPPEPDGGFGVPPPPADGGGDSDCCPTNSIDLDPLAIECADKFPCGLFAYAAGFIAAFDVTPEAPRFDIAVPGVSNHFVVDLASVEGLDDYMALIRTILSVCMWAGAVWWLASRLLKFDATGDPGAAVDDGMPL